MITAEDSTSSFFDALTGLSKSATDVLGALSKQSTDAKLANAAQTTANANAVTASTFARILPWAIGGVILIVLGFVLFRRGK